MPLKHAIKVVLAVGEAFGKALGRAVKEEIRQSQHAAERVATSTGQSGSEARDNATSNAKLGITLEESLQILNIKAPLNAEEVTKNYEHLFHANDKANGGTLYLQSKVYRAKERIDEELMRQEAKQNKDSENQEKSQ
ncbi:unnamed protein product [Auanema sp. JU1783]|nr:unnamed protein product [Auanema sp. JU1783]